jgi:hypothetical protein
MAKFATMLRVILAIACVAALTHIVLAGSVVAG